MLFPSLANFIFAFLSIFLPPDVAQRSSVPSRNTLNFQLRHLHAVTPSAHVYFADVPPHSSLHTNAQPLSIPVSPVRTARPQSAAAFAEARALTMRRQSATLDWHEDVIPGPDASKRETLLLLAKMTSNAYVEPNTDGWYNLTDEWDIVRHLPPLQVTYFRG
jgi:lipase ATG15